MKKLLASFTASVFISAMMLIPSVAHAQVAAAVGNCALGGAISSIITNSLSGLASSFGGLGSSRVPTSNSELEQKAARQDQKSFSLDRLASCAAKQIVAQMTLDTLQWARTGFHGGPAFLTNPQKYFLNLADNVAGSFIANGPLRNLCSPWNTDVRLALAMNQASRSSNGIYVDRYTCSLSHIVNGYQGASIDGFIKGDFSQGGYPAFLSMTVDGQNGVAQYWQAREDINSATNQKTADKKQEVQNNGGFLSFRTCEDVPAVQDGLNAAAANVPNSDTSQIPAGDSTQSVMDSLNSSDGIPDNIDDATSVPTPGSATVQKCSVATPGSLIAHSLNSHLDTGLNEAQAANDINSVITDALTKLVSQTLTKGLTGLGSGGSSASGGNNLNSVISQLQNQAYGSQTVNVGGQVYTVQGTNVTTNGQSPQAAYSQAIATLSGALDALNQAKSCLSASSYSVGNYSSSYSQAQIAAIDGDISGKIMPAIQSLTAKQAAAANATDAASIAAAQSDLAQATSLAQSAAADAGAASAACQSGSGGIQQ